MTDITGPTDRGKWQDLLENRKLILLWAAILLGSALVMTNRDAVPWLSQYPDQWVMPVSDFFAAIISWFESNLKWLFRAVSGVLGWPMWAFNETLRSLPWLTIVGMLVLMPGKAVARGWRFWCLHACFTSLVLAIGWKV